MNHNNTTNKTTNINGECNIDSSLVCISQISLGSKYKYRMEDVGVFTIIKKEKNCLIIQRHCGRTNTVLNDDTMVYAIK